MIQTPSDRCITVVLWFAIAAGLTHPVWPQAPENRERAKEDPSQEQPRLVLGASSRFEVGPKATRLLEAGSVLSRTPRLDAEAIITVPDLEPDGRRAEVLEERTLASGTWQRLRWAERIGWLRVSGPEIGDGSGLAILDDPDRLARREARWRLAREIAANGTEMAWRFSSTGGTRLTRTAPGAIDPDSPTTAKDPPKDVRLLTSITDRRSIRQLTQLIECLPSLHAQRNGPSPDRVDLPILIVAFSREEEYERFLGADGVDIEDIDTIGFESDGVVVFHADERLEADLLGGAAHEITHGLNRRYFARRAPPPWIEEALAEDLAHSVEAAVADYVSLCKRPGGWARTVARSQQHYEGAEPVTIVDLTRSARARTVICSSSGHSGEDVRLLNRYDLSRSPARSLLYLESVAILRSARRVSEPFGPDWFFEPRLLEGSVDAIVDAELLAIPWRVVEQGLISCSRL